MLPTFDQLTAFLKAHPAATICEIRDHFGQRGEHTFTTKEGRNSRVVAYGIDKSFWRHLQQFMKQDCVRIQIDPLACVISDSILYSGKQVFLPIFLTMQ